MLNSFIIYTSRCQWTAPFVDLAELAKGFTPASIANDTSLLAPYNFFVTQLIMVSPQYQTVLRFVGLPLVQRRRPHQLDHHVAP